MKRSQWLVTRIALAALALFVSLPAFGRPWPSRPISVVVVFAAGGTADIVGRTLAAQLSAQLHQQVIIENKPGAGGTIGATAVAHSKPDAATRC